MLEKNEKEANRISGPSIPPSEALQKMAHTLGERVKELNCLYEISNVVEKPGISLDEILQSIVNLIPPACQYPQITCAHITLGKQVFTSGKCKYKPTQWKMTHEIRLHGNRIGEMQIWYMKEMPKMDHGAFLKEEKYLLNEITERVGRIIELKRLQEVEKEAAAAIATAEAAAYSQGILDSMGEGLVVLDMQGRITDVNTSFLNLTAYSKEELIGKSPDVYLPEREKERVAAVIRDVIAKGRDAKNFEQTIMAKDGKEIIVSLNSAFLRDAQGKKISVIAIFRDVTEVKEGQEKLQSKVKELEDFHDVAVGTELELVRLETEIERLKKELVAGRDGKKD